MVFTTTSGAGAESFHSHATRASERFQQALLEQVSRVRRTYIWTIDACNEMMEPSAKMPTQSTTVRGSLLLQHITFWITTMTASSTSAARSKLRLTRSLAISYGMMTAHRQTPIIHAGPLPISFKKVLMVIKSDPITQFRQNSQLLPK